MKHHVNNVLYVAWSQRVEVFQVMQNFRLKQSTCIYSMEEGRDGPFILK